MGRAPLTIAYALESELSVRGGVNVLVETLIDALPRDWRVILVSTDPPGTAGKDLHPRVDAHFSWVRKTSRHNAIQLAQRLAEARTDLVHFHGGIFGFGMRFFGHCPIRHLNRRNVRTVWTNHTWISVLSDFCSLTKPLWFRLGFLPWAWLSRMRELRALDALIAVSRYTLEKERFWYAPARRKMRLIYHATSHANVPYRHPTRENTIVSVGHVAWRKGQLTLLRAFAQIAHQFVDWRLLIIGGPAEQDYFEQLQTLVADRSLAGSVDLMGSRRDAAAYVAKAGIFVQPSVWEGLPIALQEAMTQGAACIATDCQGNDELITDERDGLLVPVHDHVRLSHALERLIRDPALRSRLGKAARESVLARGMSVEAMAQHHLDLYGTLVSTNPMPC